MNVALETELLRLAAEEELKAIELITGPLKPVYAEAVRTAFKGGAAFGAARKGCLMLEDK